MIIKGSTILVVNQGRLHLLDNTIFIWYFNFHCLNLLGLVAASVSAQDVLTHPQFVHNFFTFLLKLNMLSKNEFLSYLIGEREPITTCNYWIPAFAGMTVKGYVGLFTNV